MRSDRNRAELVAVVRASLVDWDMRSDRNARHHPDKHTQSLVDWDMRSDRNKTGAVVVTKQQSSRLGYAL